MPSLRRFARRLRVLLGRRSFERDLDDELRFHIEMQAAKHVERGMSPAAARALAEREFGRMPRYKDEVRDARGVTFADDVARDVRFAARALRRSAGFTAVAVVTLALGIGATTAIFTVVNAVLLRPLPYPAPARLVALWQASERSPRAPVSVPNFRDWRVGSRSFAAMATYRGGTTTVLGGAEPTRVDAYLVSGDFFRVFGVRALRGRTFLAEDARTGAGPVAVVSEGFWRRSLGADPNLTARRLQLHGMTFTLVGVMPSRFRFPEGADVWVPRELFDAGESRTALNESVVARLADGVTLAQAQGEMSAIAARLAAEYPKDSMAPGATVVALHEELVGNVRTYLRLLLGAVSLVLLIACVNLASANLARAAVRSREMAIRTSLGASRRRLVQQLLTENVILALAGGAAGVVLAVWLVRGVLAVGPRSLPRAAEVGVSTEVLAFALGVSLLAGFLIGVLPALQVSASDLRAEMMQGGRGTVGRGRRGARGALLAVEVALALVLLVGAGLLIRSFQRLLSQSPGFDASGMLTAELSLPGTKYGDGGRRAAYYDRVLPELSSLPGVEAVGAISSLPLSWGPSGSFEVAGRADTPDANYRVVGGDYFAAMRIPLLRGRLFTAPDDSMAPHVTVVNQRLAAQLWPGQDPIGKRIRPLGMDAHPNQWLTVVGVVGDVRQQQLSRAPRPEHYVFYRQRPERSDYMAVAVRAREAPAQLAAAVRATLRRADPDVPVEISTMEQRLAESVSERRFSMLVLTGFGGVALLLAAVGIYGVLSYAVVRRTSEIGVRMALGAGRGRVLAMVLRDSMAPVVVGTAAGVVGAAALTRLMSGMLYEVSATDPATIGAVVALLTGVALAPSYIPARRAARVDPMVALRAE